jgi:hypothetical protein
MKRTKEVLNRVDDYLRLMRFKYTELEKLSRLNILNDYYKTQEKEASTEKFTVQLECAEQLASETLILPLKVRGVFLTEGRPKAKYYTREELEKAANNPVNNNFPLMLDHKDNEAGKVIGMVDKIKYNPSINGLQWWGHINDETFARNVLDGAIKDVSATIYSTSEHSQNYGLVGKDLTFKELSLVIKGAEPNNYIEVDK